MKTDSYIGQPRKNFAEQNSNDCGVSARLRGLKFLCMASGAVGFTLTLQIALNANFAVE
jgi:hypothetical protein